MSQFPHQYQASASALPEGLVSLTGENLPELHSAPPTAFGGPGDQWSPEDFFVGAVADCFVLSFRAIAAMSKFEWVDLKAEAIGTLDKVERAIQFTEINLQVHLTIPAGADEARAQRLLEKAEQTCFITNSLKVEPHLEVTITTA